MDFKIPVVIQGFFNVLISIGEFFKGCILL